MIENITDKVVATGNIPNTDINVNINTDNTVNVISKADTSNSNKIIFSKNVISSISIAYDTTNNKIVIAYRDYGNLSYGTAIIGTVENDKIIFGDPVVFNSDDTNDISTTYDSTNNKVIIAYSNESNSYYGTAIVGTVSGTSISFSIPVVFNSNYTDYISTTYDSANNKVVIAYRDDGNLDDDNSGYGTAIVGTVENDRIIFGDPVVFNSGDTNDISTTYDSTDNKVIIAYRNDSNSGYGTAIVGSIENNSIIFGTPVVFNSNYTDYISTTYDFANNKVVIAYRDDGNSGYGAAIVGNVEDNSIIFGNPVVFNNNYTNDISITYDSTNNKVVIVYIDNSNLYRGTAIVGTVEDNTIIFGSPVVFNNKDTWSVFSIYDSVNNKLIIVYDDESDLNYGVAMI